MSARKKPQAKPQRNWSAISERNLATCHPDLVRVLEAALQDAPYDFRVIEGHRSKVRQNKAFAEGRSKLQYPKSKHNSFPSRAVDLIPLPLDWENVDMFVDTANHILAVAEKLGVAMRWGGDWDMDGDWREHRFFDGPHFELL